MPNVLIHSAWVCLYLFKQTHACSHVGLGESAYLCFFHLVLLFLFVFTFCFCCITLLFVTAGLCKFQWPTTDRLCGWCAHGGDSGGHCGSSAHTGQRGSQPSCYPWPQLCPTLCAGVCVCVCVCVCCKVCHM